LDINTLLQDVLHRSESRAAAALLQNAVKGSAAEADDPETSEPEAADTPTKVTTPPIYQTYLDERLRLVGSPSGAGKDKRRRDSAEYRKKMVAAYLSICHDLRLRHIPYAFADMVFGVSDNCVRDFLAQLHEIFVACDSDLCTFLKRRVPLETQSRAIRAASENKRDSIPGSGVSTPVQTGYLIKGLAIITASLQCSSADGRHLRSSERGEFILQSRHGADDECASVLSVIVDAADAGFLRVHWASGEISSFRVHASLAPAYGFSYRGAYYLVKIDVSEILKLRDSANDDELQKNAIEAVRRISISDDDLPRLPFVDPDDGI
jgi:hypothetical protein